MYLDMVRNHDILVILCRGVYMMLDRVGSGLRVQNYVGYPKRPNRGYVKGHVALTRVTAQYYLGEFEVYI